MPAAYRLTYSIVFDKLLSRERLVPLTLAGRVVLPAAPAMSDAQKEKTLHAFKIRCVQMLLLYKTHAHTHQLTRV